MLDAIIRCIHYGTMLLRTRNGSKEFVHSRLLLEDDLDKVINAGCMGSNPDLIRDRRIEEAIHRADLPHAEDVQGQVCWSHRQALHAQVCPSDAHILSARDSINAPFNVLLTAAQPSRSQGAQVASIEVSPSADADVAAFNVLY